MFHDEHSVKMVGAIFYLERQLKLTHTGNAKDHLSVSFVLFCHRGCFDKVLDLILLYKQFTLIYDKNLGHN